MPWAATLCFFKRVFISHHWHDCRSRPQGLGRGWKTALPDLITVRWHGDELSLWLLWILRAYCSERINYILLFSQDLACITMGRWRSCFITRVKTVNRIDWRRRNRTERKYVCTPSETTYTYFGNFNFYTTYVFTNK